MKGAFLRLSLEKKGMGIVTQLKRRVHMNANAKELVPTKKNEMPYLGSKKSWSIALFCLLDARCHVEETKQSLS